jgi:hypothetical protein
MQECLFIVFSLPHFFLLITCFIVDHIHNRFCCLRDYVIAVLWSEPVVKFNTVKASKPLVTDFCDIFQGVKIFSLFSWQWKRKSICNVWFVSINCQTVGTTQIEDI